MTKLFIDECVLFLKDSKYLSAFEDEGWQVEWVGKSQHVPFATSDQDIYTYALSHRFSHILTANSKDFNQLQSQTPSAVKIVSIRKPIAGNLLVEALKIDMQKNPNQTKVVISQSKPSFVMG